MPSRGTVIADEDDERAFWPSYICERISLAVYTCKREIACLPTEGAYGGCSGVSELPRPTASITLVQAGQRIAEHEAACARWFAFALLEVIVELSSQIPQLPLLRFIV